MGRSTSIYIRASPPRGQRGRPRAARLLRPPPPRSRPNCGRSTWSASCSPRRSGLELRNSQFRGKVLRVDYEKNLAYVDVNLPTDGRLDFQTVQFDNPDYTRNTAYTIQRVYRDDGRSVLDLGSQRTILGMGRLEADPESGAEMTSLIPHEYARGLTRGGLASWSASCSLRPTANTRPKSSAQAHRPAR